MKSVEPVSSTGLAKILSFFAEANQIIELYDSGIKHSKIMAAKKVG
jgi:hypothetical protein